MRVEEFQKAKLRFNCTNVHEYTTQYIAGDHCYLSFFYETRNPLSINHDIGILQYIVDAAQLVVLGELRNESLAVCRIWACAVESAKMRNNQHWRPHFGVGRNLWCLYSHGSVNSYLCQNANLSCHILVESAQLLDFWLVVTGCHEFYFPIHIGFLSSSQLTNSYFSGRGGEKPPTRFGFASFRTRNIGLSWGDHEGTMGFKNGHRWRRSMIWGTSILGSADVEYFNWTLGGQSGWCWYLTQ